MVSRTSISRAIITRLEADGESARAAEGNEFRMSTIQGPVAVLIDATYSSATFQFANAIKAARIAPFVSLKVWRRTQHAL